MGYPKDWTQFSVDVSSFAGSTGRLALRYFVTNGGPSGTNSDYIGIDTLRVSSTPSAVPEPGTLLLVAASAFGLVALRRRKIA